MSWRWVVDTRGPEAKIDGKWLAVAIVAGSLISAILFAVLPSPLSYVVLAALAVLGIIVDALLRRDHDSN